MPGFLHFLPDLAFSNLFHASNRHLAQTERGLQPAVVRCMAELALKYGTRGPAR